MKALAVEEIQCLSRRRYGAIVGTNIKVGGMQGKKDRTSH